MYTGDLPEMYTKTTVYDSFLTAVKKYGMFRHIFALNSALDYGAATVQDWFIGGTIYWFKYFFGEKR